MKRRRRRFLHLAAGAAVLTVTPRITAAQQRAAAQAPLEPLVWPVVTKVPPEVRTFAGHANTVPDIVGRFGTLASLVIFTEGNHLMVLHSDVILVTVPQPIVIQTIKTGAIALGNLTLDFSRASGYYPDIVMGGRAPLQALLKL